MTVNHIVLEQSRLGDDAGGFLDFELRAESRAALRRHLLSAPASPYQALASYVPEADEHQQRVIDAAHDVIRLVAPAGSGKTQTVVNRIIQRIKGGLSPSRILVLTFDNSAAESLRDKLEAQAAKAGFPVPGITISTLNAYGYGMLHDYVPAEYRKILRQGQGREFFKQVKADLREVSPERYAVIPSNLLDRYFLDLFSLLKNELFDPRAFDPQRLVDFLQEARQAAPLFENPDDDQQLKLALQAVLWLFTRYDQAMQSRNLMDFDDQKLRCYRALAENSQLLGVIQSKYSEVIVDEFQDINLLDFSLIQQIAGKAKLMVTGDDDQAIYGFRGCTPDFIIDLESHLGQPVMSHELSKTYRCPPNIVLHANQLISHNRRRIPKDPKAHRAEDGNIIVVSSLTAGLEAKAVVDYIQRAREESPGLGYQDFAILYRTNAQSLPLQVEFIVNQIPYHVRREDNILANDALDHLLGLLRVKLALASGQVPTALDQLRFVESYFRYVRAQSSSELVALFSQSRDFIGAISSESFYRILSKASESQFLPATQAVLGAATLIDTFDILSQRFPGLRQKIGSLEDALNDKAPLAEIYEVGANFQGNIAEFVETMESALERARSSDAGEDRESGIALLTYFKSKGLQWHTVMLTSCNEGIIPHRRAPIEDERRLFYVAMTRASENLFISYVTNSCRSKVAPSRFLAEAGLV